MPARLNQISNSPDGSISDSLPLNQDLVGTIAAADLRHTVGEAAEVRIDLPHSANFSARCFVCLTRVVRIDSVDGG